jgi:hypothetical protein
MGITLVISICLATLFPMMIAAIDDEVPVLKHILPSFIIVVNPGCGQCGITSNLQVGTETDTFLSFNIPPKSDIPGSSGSSVCRLAITAPYVANATATATGPVLPGMDILQLIDPTLTDISVISYNAEPPSQFIGTLEFDPNPDDDVASDEFNCGFGSTMQLQLTQIDGSNVEVLDDAMTQVSIEILNG